MMDDRQQHAEQTLAGNMGLGFRPAVEGHLLNSLEITHGRSVCRVQCIGFSSGGGGGTSSGISSPALWLLVATAAETH